MQNAEILRKEHDLVRNKVAFYDFTLETLEVTGKDAKEFLDYIFVNDVAKMQSGKALYTTMLDEEGNVLDDLILFCRAEDTFWITTGFIDQLKNWLNKHVGNKEVNFEDITEEKAIYAVQGPKSRDTINNLVDDKVDGLKTFDFLNTKVNGIDVMVARTGFTGELGYELHFNPKHMEDIAEALKVAGNDYGIEEIVEEDVMLGSLPGEKGFITDADFVGANPVELGLGWTVNCDKDFIGKEKTCKYKKEGLKQHLLGFTIDADHLEIDKEAPVKLNGEDVGVVTTFTYGFTVDKYIGYALVESKATVGDQVTIETSSGDVETELQERMFYDPKGKKVRA